MKVAWGNKVDNEFLAAATRLCINLGWKLETHLSALMSCIAFESAHTFSPSVKNKQSGAQGLIQFMPSTAKGLGTTTEALAAMSATEQFKWVEKYFKPYAKAIANNSTTGDALYDMYLSILMPKYVGASLDTTVFQPGTIAYQQNSGFDSDHDGRISVLEITARIGRELQLGMALGAYREI